MKKSLFQKVSGVLTIKIVDGERREDMKWFLRPLENTSSTNGCGVSCGGFPSIQPRLAKAKMSFWQR